MVGGGGYSPRTVSKPRVLFLTQRFLFPMDTGGRIRTGKILEQLRNLWDITLVGNYEERTDRVHLEKMQALGERYLPVPWTEKKKRSVGWYFDVLKKSASRYPVTVLNDTSPGMKDAVRTELATGKYDLFVCDFLQSALNAPDPIPCASLLFTHNVESRIVRRHFEQAKNPALRLFWKQQADRMTRFEGEAPARYDRIVAVSDSDKEEFENSFKLTGVRTIPTGVDTDLYHPLGLEKMPGSIVFAGSMNWMPNQDGMRWFVHEILPRIRKSVPGAKLTVVGKAPPASLVQELAREQPGLARAEAPEERRRDGDTGAVIEFTGWVDDVKPYVDRAACYIVPLRIGGGTRIKIFEALGMEKALVSTTIGAEGLEISPGEHYWQVDEPDAFADAVIECLTNPARAVELGKRAREFVKSNFGWDNAARVFAEIGQEAIEAYAVRTK